MPSGITVYNSRENEENAFLEQNIGDFLCITPYSTQVVPVSSASSSPPWLEILVQPKSKMRFRYPSEKGSHGTLTGEKCGNRITYPTVKLHNYTGTMPAYLVANLYTVDVNPILHVHTLRKADCSDETFSIDFDDHMTAVMQKVKIMYCKAKSVSDVIRSRKKALLGNNHPKLKKEIDEETKRIKKIMNAVKICFEAYCVDSCGEKTCICNPVFSNSVMHCISDLVINHISKVSGSAAGEEEVFILCSKVDKKDIQIKFVEYRVEGDCCDSEEVWSAEATLEKVHHQYAMVLRTPPYRDTNITENVAVQLYLYQPSKNETSQQIQFIYHPVDVDSEGTSRKRKKINVFENSDISQPVPSFRNTSQNNSSPALFHQTSHTSNYSTASPSSSSGLFSAESTHFDSSDQSQMSPKDHPHANKFADAFTQEKTLMSLNDHPHLDKMVDEFSSEDSNAILEGALPLFESLPPANPDLLLTSRSEFPADFSHYDMQTDSAGSPMAHAQGGDASEIPFMPYTPSVHHKKPVSTTSAIRPWNIVPSDISWDRREIEHLEGQCLILCHKFDSHLSLQPSEDSREKKFEFVSQIITSGNLAEYLEGIVECADMQDCDGNNLLHLAILHQADKANMISSFCQVLGSTFTSLINQRNKKKHTPFHLAVMEDYSTILQMLYNNGGNASIADRAGDTALHLAVKWHSHRCLEVLFGDLTKVNINALNNEGITALHCAVMEKCTECVKLLCNSGACADLIDLKSGRTAVHLACLVFPQAVKDLVKLPSADLDAQDYSGNTALHLASSKGSYDAVNILLKYGASPSIRNYDSNENSDLQKSGGTQQLREGQGKVPADLTNDTRILELLSTHLPVCSKLDVQVDNSCHNTPRKEAQDSDSDVVDSGFISGSIPHLSSTLLKQICSMLDPPSDGWQTLAPFLGLDDSYVKSIPKLDKSPTKAIIERFLKESGTEKLGELKNALEFAGFPEAAKLL